MISRSSRSGSRVLVEWSLQWSMWLTQQYVEHGRSMGIIYNTRAEVGEAYSKREAVSEIEWVKEKESEREEGFIAQDLLLLPRGAEPTLGATPTTNTVAYMRGYISSSHASIPDTCLSRVYKCCYVPDREE